MEVLNQKIICFPGIDEKNIKDLKKECPFNVTNS